MYDIEAGQIVISRDVTFDESTFEDGTFQDKDEEVDEAADLMDDLNLSDDEGPRTFKQTGKRKVRSKPDNQEQARRRRRGADLEEASAPEHDLEPSGSSKLSARRTARSRSTRLDSSPKVLRKNTASTTPRRFLQWSST